MTSSSVFQKVVWANGESEVSSTAQFSSVSTMLVTNDLGRQWAEFKLSF